MLHVVAGTKSGRLLFRTWEEGLHLRNALVEAFPALAGLVVMPDHFHLLIAALDAVRLQRVMSGHTRYLAGRRLRPGPLWNALQSPDQVPNAEHLRRLKRYLALNPCRARLAADPLGWPLSTYRDEVGLAAPPVVRLVADPWAWHRYVGGDDTVAGPRELPFGRGVAIPVDELRDALSAVTRTPLSEYDRKGRARGQLVRAAAQLGPPCRTELARVLGVGRSAVSMAARVTDPALEIVQRVAGDRRFEGIVDGDLREGRDWQRYCRKRGLVG